MSKKNKNRLIILIVSIIVTAFIFYFARMAACVERGSVTGFGGEICLLFIPLISVVFYENLVDTIKTFSKGRKYSVKQEDAQAKIKITKIHSMQVKSL